MPKKVIAASINNKNSFDNAFKMFSFQSALSVKSYNDKKTNTSVVNNVECRSQHNINYNDDMCR